MLGLGVSAGCVLDLNALIIRIQPRMFGHVFLAKKTAVGNLLARKDVEVGGT